MNTISLSRLGLQILAAVFLGALCLLLRFSKAPEVFAPEGITFVDADCYTRMARVQRLALHPLSPVHRHDFENHPDGIRSHATSPMDYLILGVATAMRPFSREPLDLAGAWISPLLGLALMGFLWWWIGVVHKPGSRFLTLAAYAILPALAWGQNIGRPDHQSLILLAVAVGLGIDVCIARWPDMRAFQWWGGSAWGLALWTSLYEPLILLCVLLVVRLLSDWRGLLLRRARWWIGLTAVCAIGFAIDGWNISKPDPGTLPYLNRWLGEIGELRRLDPLQFTFWFGGWLWALPLLIFLAGRLLPPERRQFALLGTATVVVTALCVWHVRWTALLGVLCCMLAVPLFLSLPGRFWHAVVWFFFFVPVFVYFVHAGQSLARPGPYSDTDLRMIARRINTNEGVLAPWWISPALLYFSGAPIVASSSHESIAGTVDTARFFIEPDWRKCLAILDRRRVRWIVADHPGRVLSQSIRILGLGHHTEDEAMRIRSYSQTLAARLHNARAVPPVLKLRSAVRDFRLYEYVPEPASALTAPAPAPPSP